MRFLRTRYKFTHPKESTPIYIKAWSEKGAWKKFEGWVIASMYGKWALTYHAAPVDRIVRACKCEIDD